MKRLEYRGYDSAGVAVVNKDGKLDVRRSVGKLKNLESALEGKGIKGSLGIGHTRWLRTAGRPRRTPIRTGQVELLLFIMVLLKTISS